MHFFYLHDPSWKMKLNMSKFLQIFILLCLKIGLEMANFRSWQTHIKPGINWAWTLMWHFPKSDEKIMTSLIYILLTSSQVQWIAKKMSNLSNKEFKPVNILNITTNCTSFLTLIPLGYIYQRVLRLCSPFLIAILRK